MSRGTELAVELGKKLVGKRNAAIGDSFFEEVSKKEYDKYFGKGPRGGKPYLTEGVHGMYDEDESGRRHYFMIARKRRKYRKSKRGKKIPALDEMNRQAKMAEKLLKGNAVEQTAKGCTVRLAYEKTPAECKGKYEFTGGTVVKSGRLNYAEKEIIESVTEWSAENGLTIEFTMEAKE